MDINIMNEFLYLIPNQNNSACSPDFFNKTVFVSRSKITVVNFSLIFTLSCPKTIFVLGHLGSSCINPIDLNCLKMLESTNPLQNIQYTLYMIHLLCTNKQR